MTTAERVMQLFPAGGYFVEAGAHDGVGDSQTLELERAGWQGLCVEPSSAFAGLKASRKCKVDSRVLDGAPGTARFRTMLGEAVELSGLPVYFKDHWDRENRPHRDELRECVTLPRMLDDHGAPAVIEFLCLDTEGSELAILQAHDFARYRFLSMMVEYNGVDQRRAELLKLLAPFGYRIFGDDFGDDGINLFLIHKSFGQ